MKSRIVLVIIAAAMLATIVFAQGQRRHLNPMIDLLAEKKAVFGVSPPNVPPPASASGTRGGDRGLHDVDEGGHVMVRDPLPLGTGLDERLVHRGREGPAGGGVGRGHDPEGRPGLGGQELDLQPAAEAGDVAEDGRHLRQAVAGDHPRIIPRPTPRARAAGRPAAGAAPCRLL